MYQFLCWRHESITVVYLVGILILFLKNRTACSLLHYFKAISILCSNSQRGLCIIDYSDIDCTMNSTRLFSVNVLWVVRTVGYIVCLCFLQSLWLFSANKSTGQLVHEKNSCLRMTTPTQKKGANSVLNDLRTIIPAAKKLDSLSSGSTWELT